METPPASTPTPARTPLAWPTWLAYLLAGLAYGPVAGWLAQHTQAHQQLLHAFMVLGLAGVLLLTERKGRWRPAQCFDASAQFGLLASLALLALALLSGQNLVLLPGLVVLVGSLLRFLLGPSFARLGWGILGAFGVFTTLAVLMPLFDWPLRALAGKYAGAILGLFGKATELQLGQRGSEVFLLLRVDGFPFEVAAECNGFGVITASLLLSTLLAVTSRLKLFDAALVVVMAGVAGVGFNLVRIVIIVLLAPQVGHANYHVMHEAVGLVTYYGCLALIWWFIRGFRSARER